MVALFSAGSFGLLAGLFGLLVPVVVIALIHRGRAWGVLFGAFVMLLMVMALFAFMGAGPSSRSRVSTSNRIAVSRSAHQSTLDHLHGFFEEMLEQDQLSEFVQEAEERGEGEAPGESGIVFASDGVGYNIQVEVPSAAPRVPRLGERIRAFARSPSQWPRQAWVGGSLARSLLVAIAIAAFLFIGYVVLDGSTRGQFTWPLRLASLVAFATIYFAVSALNS